MDLVDTRSVYMIVQALDREIRSKAEAPAGLLLTLAPLGTCTETVVAALRVGGYTVAVIADDVILVGGVDEASLLEGQIELLAQRRQALLADRETAAQLQEAF